MAAEAVIHFENEGPFLSRPEHRELFPGGTDVDGFFPPGPPVPEINLVTLAPSPEFRSSDSSLLAVNPPPNSVEEDFDFGYLPIGAFGGSAWAADPVVQKLNGKQFLLSWSAGSVPQGVPRYKVEMTNSLGFSESFITEATSLTVGPEVNGTLLPSGGMTFTVTMLGTFSNVPAAPVLSGLPPAMVVSPVADGDYFKEFAIDTSGALVVTPMVTRDDDKILFRMDHDAFNNFYKSAGFFRVSFAAGLEVFQPAVQIPNESGELTFLVPIPDGVSGVRALEFQIGMLQKSIIVWDEALFTVLLNIQPGITGDVS